MCDKYLGQRPIKVKRSTCQRSGMNARLPLLPVTGQPMTASKRCDVTIRGVSNFIRFTSVLCQHQSSGICFNYVLSDKNDRPLILSDKNRGNVDNTCHQPVIYDVTVNNCYL